MRNGFRVGSPVWIGFVSFLGFGCATLGTNPPTDTTDPMGAPTPMASKPAEASFSLSNQEGGISLEDEAKRLQLREEKKRVLLQHYLAQGEDAFRAGQFPMALENFRSAIEIDPENAAARNGIRRAETAMGQPSQEAGSMLGDMQNRESVRLAEARLAAEQAAAEGDRFLREGRYEQAILKFREALLILRYNPLISSTTLDAQLLQEKLRQAIIAKDSGAMAKQAELEKKAEEEKTRREDSRREYMESKIRSLFESANHAFLNERYREAELYLDQLLALDPENQEARDLRDVAISHRHETTDRDTRQRFREEWQKTFERLYQMDVPQTKTIDFDLKRWAEVSRRKPLEVAGPEPSSSPEEAQILSRLESTIFPPRFEDASVEEVTTFLQHLTGVNFLVSTAVRDLDPDKKKIRLELPDTSVKKVLDILPDVTGAGLRHRIRHGVVQIITPEEMKGGQYLAFYEVRDITKPIPNFPSPEVNLIPSSGVEIVEEELPERDSFLINESTLQELIRGNIATESWDADPRNTINVQRGTLVVSQTRDVHEKIKKLLQDLREATGIMVDVQSRFLTVEDNFLSDIGVDIRGLGNDASSGVSGKGQSKDFDDFGPNLPNVIGNGNDAGAFYEFQGDSDVRARAENLYDLALGKTDVLTNSGGLSLQYTFIDNVELEVILRAVQKSERVQIINAPRLLVFNTERASIRVVNKVSYVRDYNVQIAQAATIADPEVDWINAGVFLDVTPVVSSDRRFITMELRPTVANLKRPIKSLPTNLATGSPVNIQLPELEIQRVRTTVSIPDGGTVLLAGSTTVERQEFESGIPFLSKIPILRFFFSREGEFQRNKKLLILLRAKIVIPDEYEPVPTNARE